MLVRRWLAHVVICLTLVSGVSSGASVELERSNLQTSASVEQTFRAANQAYREKRFLEAQQLYEQLVEQGIVSADLFYNLGTTYAQLGDSGRAVLYLEKARRLAPRDRDIQANLRLLEPPMNRAHERLWHQLMLSLTFDEWLSVFFIVYVVCALSWAAWFWRPRAQRSRLLKASAITLSVAAIVVGTCAGVSYYYTQATRYGVVLTPGAIVRSGPAERFSELIRAPEGLKLGVETYQDPDWKVVYFPDGQLGYIRSTDIQEI